MFGSKIRSLVYPRLLPEKTSRGNDSKPKNTVQNISRCKCVCEALSFSDSILTKFLNENMAIYFTFYWMLILFIKIAGQEPHHIQTLECVTNATNEFFFVSNVAVSKQ